MRRHRHWGPCGPRGPGRWREEDMQRPSPSRLYRDPERGILKGVCAGVAQYFGIDPIIVRGVVVIALFMFPPPTIIIYLILTFVLPRRPDGLYETPAEERFWKDVRTEPVNTLSALRHRFRELEQRLRRMETYVTSQEFRLSREINDLER